MEDYIMAAIIDNEIESLILEDILAEMEIPYFIRSFHDEAYGNLFQLSRGFGEVYVPKEFEQEIKNLMEEIRKGVEIEKEDMNE